MRFAVESWDPSYGSPVEGGLSEASGPVDAAVEFPPDAWRPVSPPRAPVPDAVVFIDGVRRIDSRVWIRDGPLSRPGLCATVGAGAVVCRPTGAEVVEARVARGLHTAVHEAAPIITDRCGTYQLRPVVGDDDQVLYTGVHQHMTFLEREVSDALDASTLTVYDGPLRGRDEVHAVGYVKTQHVQYLEAPQQAVVADLDEGDRSPLFAIGGRFTRWSWYLRLPGPRAHPLSGVVRLELPGVGPAASAIDRADRVSAILPRFASQPHADPRAPQNLFPIAGLERHLRRLLGDPALLERDLRLASRSRPPVVAV
jgi:hypothetical protein